MKTILILLLSISCLFAQKRQTTQYVTIKTYVRNGALEKPFRIGYLAYLPDNYGCSDKWPLIISFHGNGEKGTLTPDVLRTSFLPNRLDNGLNIPFIVLAPQTNGYKPSWANPQFFREFLDSAIVKYPKAYTTQIYLVAYSGGGEGLSTWAKSGLPFAGIGTFSFVNKLVGDETCALNGKKIWSFHCLDDKTVGVGTTKTLIINIKKYNPKASPKTTYYTTGGHDSWRRGLATDSLPKFFKEVN